MAMLEFWGSCKEGESRDPEQRTRGSPEQEGEEAPSGLDLSHTTEQECRSQSLKDRHHPGGGNRCSEGTDAAVRGPGLGAAEMAHIELQKGQ